MSIKHFCNIVEMFYQTVFIAVFYRSGSHNCDKTNTQQKSSHLSLIIAIPFYGRIAIEYPFFA